MAVCYFQVQKQHASEYQLSYQLNASKRGLLSLKLCLGALQRYLVDYWGKQDSELESELDLVQQGSCAKFMCMHNVHTNGSYKCHTNGTSVFE